MMRVIDPDKINYVLTPSECSLIRRIYRVKAQDVKEVIQWMEEATEGAAAYFAGIDPDTLTAVRICHWISVRLMAGIKAFHANDGSAEWWVDGEMPTLRVRRAAAAAIKGRLQTLAAERMARQAAERMEAHFNPEYEDRLITQ